MDGRDFLNVCLMKVLLNKLINEKCIYFSCLVLGIVIFYFSYISAWNDDALSYSFFVERYDEDSSYMPLHNIKEVFISQVHHYLNTNGRFIVHFIVQIFCGLAGKFWFSLCNSIVWLILSYKVSTFFSSSITCKKYIFLTSLLFLIYYHLPCTPPFQINYVWVSSIFIFWIKWFLKTDSKNYLILSLLCLTSIVVGELHEGFSIPVSLGIITYWIHCKRKFSLQQYLMAIGFGIGTIILGFAPGNFLRLVGENTVGDRFLYFVEQLPNILWLPCLIFTILLFRGGVEIKEINDKLIIQPLVYFLVITIAYSFLFCFILQMAGRNAIPLNFFLILLLSSIVYKDVSNWILALIVLITGCALYYKHKDICFNRCKFERVWSLYENSSSGKIYLEEEYLSYNHSELTLRRNTFTNLKRSKYGRECPMISAYPLSLSDKRIPVDSNFVVKIAPQTWVCIQSARHPSNFVIDKIFFPGVLNKKMKPRNIDFSSKEMILDSTSNYKVAIYKNVRPYIRADVHVYPLKIK